MKKLLFLALLLMGFAVPGYACTGTSPNLTAANWADVAACHTSAAQGDKITVTTGSATVTTNTVITKYVRIICGGACTLTDNTANASDLINITESTEGHTRLEGFTFIQGSAAHTNPNGVIVLTNATGGQGILIKGNSYSTSLTSGDFIIAKVMRGVIWNNSATGTPQGANCYNNAGFVRQYTVGLTGPWTEPPFYGDDDTNGDKNLYIENNTIQNVFEAIDIYENGRAVVRYNTITNSGTLNHGADTGNLAGRHMDIYNNTFVWDTTPICSGNPAGVNSFLYFRGGPALIHDNVIPDLTSMAWGDKPEISFTNEQLRRNAGPYACWAGGYPSPYQVGWGYSTGGTQAGTSGVYQDLEPVYLWNNTGGGNYGSPSVPDAYAECGGGAPASSTYIMVNREYYLATTKPGYNAYTYPHPLTAGTIYYTAKLGCTAGACSNANSGLTRATAELTIAAGIAHLASGDTLVIGDGTYNERIATQLQSIPSGTSGAPTTIKAENLRLAVLQPNNATLGDGWYYGVSLTDPKSYITFDGLKVDTTLTTGYDFIFQTQSGTLSNINLLNVEALGADGDCAGFVSPISGCAGIILGAHNNPSGHHDFIVRNAYSHNNTEGGFYISGASNVLIEDSESTANGYSFQMYDAGNNSSTGNVIRNNRFHANVGHAGYPVYSWTVMLTDAPSIQFYNNIVSGNRGGLYVGYTVQSAAGIYFNTIYSNTLACILVDTPSSNAVIRNNICYGNGTDAITNNGTGTTSSNNLFTNPSFVNSAIEDFHLLPTSAALPPCGTAVGGITLDYDDITRPTPPSCGAYEVPSGIDPDLSLSEDFESYTAATSICGLNGGVGFTQVWQCDTGTATVETAPAGMTGKALRLTSTSNVVLHRLFTAHTGDFTISFKMRLSITNPNASGIGVNALNAAGLYQASAYFDTSGNIYSNSQQVLAVAAADTNYTIEMNFDTAGHPDQVRTRVNGGSYTSWEPCVGSCSSIAGINVVSFSTNAHTFWVDDIGEDVGAGIITVATPTLAQRCTSGSTCAIAWSNSGITGAVNVYYLVGGNQYLIASPDVTATPYSWTVNAPAGATVKVRVAQGAVTDDSDEFTVLGTKAVFAQ